MTNGQEVKLHMYNAVLAHCKEHEGITSPIPALQTAIEALRTTSTAIQTTVQQQLQTTKGYTADKLANRQLLTSYAVQVAGAVYAWATDKQDLVVLEKTRISASGLARYRDEELPPACRMFHELAVTHATALIDYGITTAVLDAYLAALNKYVTAVPTPRNAQSLRTAYKLTLLKLFATADSLLKDKMDRLSLPLQRTNRAFMNAYRSNRKIMDPGRTATQLRITVANKEGVPLKGAVVSVAALGYSVPTSSKGVILIKPILQGLYTITVGLDGYQPVELDEVRVLRGQVNVQQVTLTPSS